MDDVSFSKKANISAICRFDSEVKDIVISASQVALYVFNRQKSAWIKKKVEGACFFYKRKTNPKYGIFILNRLDTSNFIEHMNSKMEMQLQEPYLLFRNTLKTIYGIWFYEKSDCTAMANVFQRILKELKEKEKQEQDEEENDLIVNNQNGHDWNQTSNSQPDSVRQFFAKASKEVTKPQSITQASTLCGSFQSVANIEKVQKTDNLENSRNISGAFDIIGDKCLKNDVCLVTRKPDQMKKDELINSSAVIENNMKVMNLRSSLAAEGKLNAFSKLDDSTSVSSEFPELIPPSMLLTPSDLSTSFFKTDIHEMEKPSKRNILNKAQMIQAMEYLLKHDSQFTDKLYDAYLKSSKMN